MLCRPLVLWTFSNGGCWVFEQFTLLLTQDNRRDIPPSTHKLNSASARTVCRHGYQEAPESQPVQRVPVLALLWLHIWPSVARSVGFCGHKICCDRPCRFKPMLPLLAGCIFDSCPAYMHFSGGAKVCLANDLHAGFFEQPTLRFCRSIRNVYMHQCM